MSPQGLIDEAEAYLAGEATESDPLVLIGGLVDALKMWGPAN